MRYNRPASSLWDEGKAHIRKVLEQERSEHTILAKEI
jgi:hypothetical protein